MLRCAYLELSFEEVQVPILGVARCSSGSLCSSQLVMAVLQVYIKTGLLLQGTAQLFGLGLQGSLSGQKPSPAHAVTDMGR